MKRERMIAAALLAYPPDMRERLGGEMGATLLDASAGSNVAFGRELADLTRLGLRARATRTAADGARRVVADGVCLAAVWLMVLDLSTLLAQTLRGEHDPLLAPASLITLGVALAFALAGWDRVAGALALAWTAARLPALLHHYPSMPLAVLAVSLPSIACFATLVVLPRRRARDPLGLAWLIVPVTLVAALGPPKDDQSPLLLAFVALAALVVVVYAVAMLPTDPRLAIAGAIPLSSLGLGVTHTAAEPFAVLVLMAAPAVLAVEVSRIRALQRRAPI
jgi:hypothetical protein